MSSSLSGETFQEFGVPEALSYRPSPYMSSLNIHSIYDRALNIYASFMFKASFWLNRRKINSLMKERFGDDYPTIAEQSANVAYIFTNSEPLLEFAAPTLTKVISIQGIGAKIPKPLDEYWTNILNLRKKTILVSFGSMIESRLLATNNKMAMVESFSQFPDVTFIWKYEEPDDEFSREHSSKLANVVLTKWMPQVDILAHPNVVSFITHGGM
ncbi:hypothetical protein PFISCL1PPCAC_7248, partial [Pristionchus fissidentatus]